VDIATAVDAESAIAQRGQGADVYIVGGARKSHAGDGQESKAGARDVPAAALDSQENKYLFVRYIEKTEKLKILTSTLSRASDPRAK
jgi:hypothetical protein